MHKDTCGRLKELCPEDLGVLIQSVAAKVAALTIRDGKRPWENEVEDVVNEKLDLIALMAHQAEHGLE